MRRPGALSCRRITGRRLGMLLARLMWLEGEDTEEDLSVIVLLRM